MAGNDGREEAGRALVARLRTEIANLDDIALALRWRGAAHRLLRHPKEPAYRIEFQVYTIERERRRDERLRERRRAAEVGRGR